MCVCVHILCLKLRNYLIVSIYIHQYLPTHIYTRLRKRDTTGKTFFSILSFCGINFHTSGKKSAKILGSVSLIAVFPFLVCRFQLQHTSLKVIFSKWVRNLHFSSTYIHQTLQFYSYILSFLQKGLFILFCLVFYNVFFLNVFLKCVCIFSGCCQYFLIYRVASSNVKFLF